MNNLANFTGDPSELSSWINDAQDLISVFKTTSASAIPRQNKFHMICVMDSVTPRMEPEMQYVCIVPTFPWEPIFIYAQCLGPLRVHTLE